MSRNYKVKECCYCKQEKTIAAKDLCRSCYQRYRKNGTPEYQRKGIKNKCSQDECHGYAVSHGLCDMHRKRLVKHGHLNPTRPNDWGNREKHPLYSVWVGLRRFRGIQLCTDWKCDFWKFVDDVVFRPSKMHKFRPVDDNAVIDKDNWHWVETVSSKSEDKKAYLRAWAREDRKNKPDKYKNKSLMKQYGIDLPKYNEMLNKQNGKCKICSKEESVLNPKTKEPRDLAVDHCHNTGKVRGLLCSRCNTALGLLKDDVSLLKQAIVYLSRN